MEIQRRLWRPECRYIGQENIILLCARILRLCDPRLVEHGDRVAWIARSICEMLPPEQRPDEKTLMLLGLFHDVGAYKTEEIDRMVEFESEHVQAHSAYGYLFLKFFTPLAGASEAILYHHFSQEQYASIHTPCRAYAELLFLADRTDVAIAGGKRGEDLLAALNSSRFAPALLKAAHRAFSETDLARQVESGECVSLFRKRITEFSYTPEETLLYLKMLVHTIDFKSETTVTHSINTTVISVAIAELMGRPEDELENLYFAAMVHDIGKMAIPGEILEYPGRLTPEQMLIMRRHVAYTEEALHGVVPDIITDIAARHHEKLDGSGYPHGLTAEHLTPCDRIVAVGDILSALSSRRSYKDVFPREKTLDILKKMAGDGQLDTDVVRTVCEQYDDIMAEVDRATKPVIRQYHAMQEEYRRLMQARPFCGV